jgi:catechol 2,3-dioxygenase-like lactoylglutathione lyase family enzyme
MSWSQNKVGWTLREKTMKLLLATGLLLAVVKFADARLPAPNAAGVTMGHVYLNVENIEVQKKFWIGVFGAVPVKRGDLQGVKLPDGMLIFMRKQVPVGGSEGCVLDHFGVKVPSLAKALDVIRAAGYTVQRELKGTEGSKNAFVVGPDDLKLEYQEDPAVTAVSIGYHLHYNFADAVKLRDWYVSTFSMGSRKRGQIDSAEVPGMSLSFSPVKTAPTPMKGHVIDHAGFEVANLEAFCKKLEASGVKLDIPYKKASKNGVASAYLTDPSGVYIELTEGLNKF